jgi:hypothetical protein
MNTVVSDDHVAELAKALAGVLNPDADSSDAAIANNQTVIRALLATPSELVKPTRRVDAFKIADSSDVFIMDHHVTAATAFFVKYKTFETRAVAFGHKHQGKTQFLFFITKLLQALGEGVVYLDKSIAPEVDGDEAKVYVTDFCPHMWQTELTTFLGGKEGAAAVVGALEQFAEDGLPMSFKKFHDKLSRLIVATGTRVWLIVDEAASEELVPFRFVLPEEQKKDIFHSIITGSVGIASLVSNRHLDKWTWDLPLFSPLEAAQLAVKLIAAKQPDNNVDLWDALGIKKSEDNASANQDLGGALHELFGGVAGYTAELVLELVKGETLSTYVLVLSTRVRDIIVKASKELASPEALAKFWLNEMRAADNTWSCVRDAGLCGSAAPRGVIFSLMLKWLLVYAPPTTDELAIVQEFRSMFDDDPGLDGHLLELEEIVKLKRGKSITAALLSLSDERKWESGDVVNLGGSRALLWTYSDSASKSYVKKSHASDDGAKWNVVLLPTGFPVIDVLLFLHDAEENTLHFYLVQITRAKDPFATHFTDETCSTKSKDRIVNVLIAAASAIKFTTKYKTSFVMLAPNTVANKHVSPEQACDYYFSPVDLLVSNARPRKRRKK